MTINILFAAQSESWDSYQEPLSMALTAAGLDFDLRDQFPPQDVHYIVYAPNSKVQDFTPFTRLKAVLNLWAGVETVVSNPTLNVPLTRMVDDGLTQGMREWVAGHVLRHHLGMDAHIQNPDHRWEPIAPPLARDRNVLVLGLGALGNACAITLAQLGFTVSGWSRSQKSIADVTCHCGDDGLKLALGHADIVILLLPDTPETTHIMNADRLGLLRRGTVILNPGRGTLIDETALLTALDKRQIGHATLDVFQTEPLPKDHRFWSHPRVTVTPHIASATRVDTASRVIADNIQRNESDQPMLFQVNRTLGY